MDLSAVKPLFDVIYISKNSWNIYFMNNNNKIYPRFIKIDENQNWAEEDFDVDGKSKSMQDLLNGKVSVLLGEQYSNFFNNEIQPIRKPSLIKENRIFKYDRNLNPVMIDSYSLGRYILKDFSVLDAYSKRIVKAKYADEKSKMFYENLYKYFLKLVNQTFDYTFYVPCKPGKNDRFSRIVSDNGIELLCDYGEIKGNGMRNKMSKMKGAFGIKESYNIIDKKILLVDDVLTTGATLLTITELLYEKGASKVTWLTFGKTLNRTSHCEVLTCPVCGNNLNVKINSRTYQSFVSCVNYQKCGYNMGSSFFIAYNYIYKP